MKSPKIVILTGAGISAESGLKTFRGSGGLWEGVPVTEVATPEAWKKDYKRVLRFYDERRRDISKAQPNAGHLELASLSAAFDTWIITQNIDDLHERAGSKNVLHLHGEIFKARSSEDESLIYDLKSLEIRPGEKCELGSQLRPHIVWFGEAVPMMEEAIRLASQAEIFAVIGTSLEVYPAAGLVDYVPNRAQKFYIDPQPRVLNEKFEVICEPASSGVAKMVKKIQENWAI